MCCICRYSTQREWAAVTAAWEHGPNSTIMVTEDALDSYFGKVESEVLNADLSRCPMLRVSASHIEPSSAYSVQIHDQRTGRSADALTNVTAIGEYTINLSQLPVWRGPAFNSSRSICGSVVKVNP